MTTTTKIETSVEQKTHTKPEDPTIEVKEIKEVREVKTKTETKASDAAARTGRAEAIIHRNVLWALGAGVLPIPLFDAIAVTGVQVKMLAELSKEYEITFSEGIAYKIVGSLLTGLSSVAVGSLIGSSLAKLLPGVGTTLGVISAPLVAGAFTHATGKVFLMHFETGGTLLDFDPHEMRAYFNQEFIKAKDTVARIQREERVKVAPF